MPTLSKKSKLKTESNSMDRLTLEEALEALEAALEQCREYSDNEWVMPMGYKCGNDFRIDEMQKRIAATLEG